MMVLTFDPTDPDFIDDPYPILNRWREETPVFRTEGQSLWFVTRHADVHALLRDRRLGRAHEHVFSRADVGLAPRNPDYGPFWAMERHSLLELEPPDHTRLRSLVSRAFTPRRVAELRPAIERTAHLLLDRLVPDGRFDFLHDFAEPFSVRVISELLGAPLEDWRRLLGWSHAIVRMYELNTTAEQAAAAVRAAEEFMPYMRDLAAQRRVRPTGDLISALVQVHSEDGSLTEDELVSTCILLLNAGHEATVNTLGNGVNALLAERAQWDRLLRGEVPTKHAVEELIRFDGPLQLFERWVLEEVEVGGRQVEVGEKLGFLFGSANRDPRQYPEPNVFDVARNDATHVGFGGGTHYCLGAPLARLEVEVALSALIERCPELVITVARPPRNPTFVQRAFRELPVAV